ncbi:MAG TPA: OmpA family protein [Alcanivoracaceae bacterium]|nr:OmpA family protein [Alcanivoracaceae bacterium]
MSKIYKSFGLLVAAVLFLTGCAIPQLTGPAAYYDPSEKIDVEADEARLVMYRSKKENQNGSPILRIDGHVIGALNPGQFLVSDVCQGPNKLVISRNQSDNRPVTLDFTAKPGETLYLRIWEPSENHFAAERVSAKLALEELKKTKNSSYLVNRKTIGCRTEAPQPVLIKEVEFSADTLFAFDSATLSDQAGRQSLDELAREIRASNVAIETIRVIGHTDRLGNPNYNQKLSEERAATVSTYLRAKGLPNKIETLGMGAKLPVTTDCQGNRATPALIECLQPDRRVTVELWGTQETR